MDKFNFDSILNDAQFPALMERIEYKAMSEFGLLIYKSDNDVRVIEQPPLHNHHMCEIYVHLTGDVTFVVENSVYPVSYGDVIITRPFENHHAFYQSKKPNNHYCIFFYSDGNEHLFDLFFNRKAGENNLISPDKKTREIILSFCNTMVSKKLSELEKTLIFFKLIDALTNAKKVESVQENLPEILLNSINYISKNLANQITMKDISSHTHVSVATLERAFKQHLGITPSKYILNRRLSLAEYMLRNGTSVTDTAMKCGFSDVSSFIQNFKKIFGMTPLKYSQYSNKR